MDKNKADNLSNAEIRIKMLALKNEYEVTQNKLKAMVGDLDKLNEEYLILQEVLNKRTKQFQQLNNF